MGREKQGYRDTIAALNEMFPDKGMIDQRDAARFMGRSIRTVQRHIKFNQHGLLTKADFARQVCV